MEKINIAVEIQETENVTPRLVGAGCGIVCLGALCATGVFC